MAFDSRQYQWADISLLVGGGDMVTIQSVKFGEKTEKEAVYGKGRKPICIQSGNSEFTGEFGILQSDFEQLISLGGGTITGLSVDCQVSFGNYGDEIKNKRIIGVQFPEYNYDFKQGDKFATFTLPWMALDIEHD